VRVAYDSAGAAAAAPRECWSVVLVESVLPRTEASGRTLFYALRTGMKLYVQPPGLVADGQVADVAVRDARPDSTGRPAGREAEVVFENTGTRHLVARGRLEFRRPDNTTAASVELPPAYALPGATARVKAELPAIAPGKYVVPRRPRLRRLGAGRGAARARGAVMAPRVLARRRRAAVPAALAGVALAAAARTASAQPRVLVTSTTLQSTVAAPTVADFQANNNAGQTRPAGAVTFNVENCAGGRTCTVSVSATAFPAATDNQLTWSVTSVGSGGGISCTPSPVATVDASPSPIIACVASGGGSQLRTATGIVVTFGYRISWASTASTTYATSGIVLQVAAQ
jgi:hypothetical protein